MPDKNSDKKSAAHYEKLGRMIEMTYLSGALDTKRLVKNSLLRGLTFGAASAIGATVVIATLFWVLSLLGEVPFVGPIFESVQQTVEEGNRNNN